MHSAEEEMEAKHGKPGGTEMEKQGSRKEERQHRESNCKAEPGREGKEEQKLSSQNPKLRRTKGSQNRGGQKGERKLRKRWNGRPRESRKREWKTKVSRRKHLRGLNPTEDKRKLQTKLIVGQ